MAEGYRSAVFGLKGLFMTLPGLVVRIACAVAVASGVATFAGAQELPGRAKALDTNGNGVIERDEARGPLASNFAAIDRDGSGGIDGAELGAFFGGGGAGTAVVADTVIEEDISQTIPVIGQLVARQSGPVASRIAGPVAAVKVRVGDRVRRGDPLVEVSPDRLRSETDRNLAVVEQKQAMVALAEAELEKSAQERRRIENLRGSSAFSQKRYDDVQQDVAMKDSSLANRKAELAQAVEQLNRANIDLRDAVIRAPYDGIVTEKNTEVGAYLGIGTPVVTLINQEALEVEVQVPTNRLAGLRPDTKVSIVLDDQTRHSASVRAVIPVENPLTRTRAVRLTPSFDDVQKPPALNQSVTVEVPISGQRTAVTVHKDAIIRQEGNPVVFVIENGRAARRDVVLGDSVGQRFVVLRGLAAGESVVIRGNEQLRAGQALRVVSNDGPPSAQTN